ncbi:MAG: c-type cytochrome [Herpetosiphonaceae bacterium]|nr:c-type cytochrome [Herpetosiphonaceae bacterium]
MQDDEMDGRMSLWQRLALPLYMQIAFGLLLAGVLLAVVAIVVRGQGRRRVLRAMQALVGLSVASCTIPFYLGQLFTPHNPYSVPTAEVLEQGNQLYMRECAPCHGVTGAGNGPAARTLPVPAANFTIPHYATHSQELLFGWTKDGIPGRGMPAFGQRLSNDQIWQVLTYIDELNRKSLGQ